MAGSGPVLEEARRAFGDLGLAAHLRMGGALGLIGAAARADNQYMPPWRSAGRESDGGETGKNVARSDEQTKLQAKMAAHLDRARELLADGNLDDALPELLLAMSELQSVARSVDGRWPEAQTGSASASTTRPGQVDADGPDPPTGDLSAGVRQQARRADRDMARLAERYAGEFIVYCDGEVLGHGRTPDAAVAGLDEEQRGLPFVLRFLDGDTWTDSMGGPKGD